MSKQNTRGCKASHTPGPWYWQELCSSVDPSKTVALELRTEAGMPFNDRTVLSVREDWIGDRIVVQGDYAEQNDRAYISEDELKEYKDISSLCSLALMADRI